MVNHLIFMSRLVLSEVNGISNLMAVNTDLGIRGDGSTVIPVPHGNQGCPYVLCR